MAKQDAANSLPSSDLPVEIDLRNPAAAAVLAWLWPGAGHLYQGRNVKGVLFMVCILATYFFGLVVGEGHVVYASWEKSDRRWQYLCQVGVGLPALPAVVQNRLVRSGKEPWCGGIMAPPAVVREDAHDELAEWNEQLSNKFDLGILYTMIAGLLNVLAICDAYAGPFVPAPEEEKSPKPDKPPG